MALDGVFLSCLRQEIEQAALLSRVDKVYQPSRDEIIINLHQKGFSAKLLMSIAGSGPRVCFTTENYENPAVPPMFCMLMRKHFIGAKLTAVKQYGFERVLDLQFDTFDELGDPVQMHLIIEIMGRQSNIIMCKGERIIDALRRVDAATATRLILPGGRYELPPAQGKSAPDSPCAAEKILSVGGQLVSAVTATLDGVSPCVAREIAFAAAGDTSVRCDAVDGQRLADALKLIRDGMASPAPYLITVGGRPTEFCYIPLRQYGASAEITRCDSFSNLLERFYATRRQDDFMRRRTQDTQKLVRNITERIVRKMEKQRAELNDCANREQLRVYGELIKANLGMIKSGASLCEVPNYYDPEYKTVRIPLNPSLSPSQNAQRYFKEYKKSYTAEQKLTEMLEAERAELDYLDSVQEELSRADSERALVEIRDELASGGYIRQHGDNRRRQQKSLPPLRFLSDDGFNIYVGRNNRQNDELTLRTAEKSDIWLHTKGIHGSHTVIAARRGEVPERTLMQAAMLAAYHSKGRQSGGVPVDYCPIRQVHKPGGAKPGMVIYDNYSTIYVTPDAAEVERLADLSRDISE